MPIKHWTWYKTPEYYFKVSINNCLLNSRFSFYSMPSLGCGVVGCLHQNCLGCILDSAHSTQSKCLSWPVICICNTPKVRESLSNLSHGAWISLVQLKYVCIVQRFVSCTLPGCFVSLCSRCCNNNSCVIWFESYCKTLPQIYK